MTNNFLYHYTSFSTFEKILSSNRIRFTRLDKLEDMYEGHSDLLSNTKKCVFVSCWVETDEDLIPHWKIYGDVNMRNGIRIGLPKNNLFDNIQHSRDSNDHFISLVPPIKNWNNDNNWNALLHDSHEVTYVNKLSDSASLNNGTANLDWSTVGLAKIRQYEFEKETRFRITPPKDGSLYNYIKSDGSSSQEPEDLAYVQNPDIPKDANGEDVYYIDSPIKAEAFKKMKVMYSPLTEEARVETIKTLCKKYGIQEEPEKSKLPIQAK